jgi:hypothetical protein
MMKVFNTFWRKGYFYILLAGILMLVFFIDSRVGMYDWKKEIAYFNFIRISLSQYHSLPLFWWNPQTLSSYPAISISSFFLANPETFSLSPFIILLYWMDALIFMKILACVFCAIGIIGIFRLRKKLKWQDGQFRIFLALFLFSPIIIQHLAIGYFPWLNLYFFPWLVFFLIDEDMVKRMIGCSSILALTLLQGGIHPFIWFFVFIGLYSLVHFIQKPGPAFILFLIASIGLTILLSFVRVSTSAQTFSDFQQKFFNGYSWNGFITWGLTPPVFTPSNMDDIEPFIESYNNGVPYWDGAIYWGAVLPLVLILFFVLVDQRKINKKGQNGEQQLILFSMAIASLLITFLSFGNLYQIMITTISEWVKIPALQAMEKYPFRFAILGYFGFSFVISHYINEVLVMVKKPITFFSLFLDRLKKKSLNYRNTPIIKRIFHWLMVVSVLYLMSLLIRSTLFSWLEPAIVSAHEGVGNAWLAGLMSRRLIIPAAAYILKAHNFYAGVQSILLLVTLTGWGNYLLYRFSGKVASFLTSPFQFLQNRMDILVEVILVIPLLFSSGMWMRVALATPYDHKLPVDLISPEITVQPSLSSVDLTPTSSQLSIMLKKPAEVRELIINPIKYSDLRFLQADDPGIRWFDNNGSLGLSTGKNAHILITVKPESYLPAFWITVASWLSAIAFTTFYYFKKKSSGESNLR